MTKYKLYDESATAVDYSTLLKSVQSTDILFFGELHNNPTAHKLELELTNSLFKLKENKLIMGLEMFESDDQLKIDEYFAGLISTQSFEREARLWNNYHSYYKPLLEFARENDLRFIATNTPRRYASFVAKNGLDALKQFSDSAQKYFAPLPIKAYMSLKTYKAMQPMLLGMKGMGAMKFISEAQALKDATMAHFILSHFKRGDLFLHFNGSYHSKCKEGIVWFLHQAQPSLKIVTIAIVEQDNIDTLAKKNSDEADFTFAVKKEVLHDKIR